MKSISRHTFNKKYTVLESKLFKFLYWREQNHSRSHRMATTPLLLPRSTSTLDQEVILMKKISMLTPEGHLDQKNLDLKQVNLFELLNDLFLPKKIFPEKPPFLKYWLIPFVGLSLLMPQNSFSKQVSSSKRNTLTTFSSNSFLPKEITASQETDTLYSNINSLYQVSFENKELSNQYEHLLKNEQNELSTLAKYYYQKLNKDLNKKDSDYKKINAIRISTEILKRESFKSSQIFWNWFTLKNPNLSLNQNHTKMNLLKRLNPEFNAANAHLFKFRTIPSKIDPNISQNFLEDQTFRNLPIVESKNLTPIESYKNAQVLLDQVTTNMMGFTNVFVSNQDSWPELKNSKSSRFISLIDQLCIQLTVTNPMIDSHSKATLLPTPKKNQSIQHQLFRQPLQPFKNAFLNSYLTQYLKTKDSQKFLALSNPMLHPQTLLKLQNQKAFYEKLIPFNGHRNVLNLNFKATNLTLANRFQRPMVEKVFVNKPILNAVYTHFYLNHCLNLLNRIQQNQTWMPQELENKNSKIARLTYELFLMQKLKSFANSSIDSNNEPRLQVQQNVPLDLTKAIGSQIRNPSEIFYNHSKDIYDRLEVTSNSIVKLKVPFKSISLFVNNESIANLTHRNHQKENSFQFLKSNRIPNQYPRVIVAKAPSLTRKNSALSQVRQQFQLLPLARQFWNPIFQINFSRFLTEMISRLSSFKSSASLAKQAFSEKTYKEFIWNSERSSLSENSKVRIRKKLTHFSKLEMHSAQDHRKMEKLLKNYLSSKIYVPNSLTTVKFQKNHDLFQKKKSFLNLLKKLKLRVQTHEKVQKEKHGRKQSEFLSKSKQEHIKPHQHIPLNPNSLLKRIGFLFLRKQDLSGNVENPDNGNKTIETFFLRQIEDRKAQQKKQRRKKQNLETRRRKKRKRWYPRPTWLRFQMYQDFLQLRHFPKQSTNSQSQLVQSTPSFLNHNSFTKFQLYRKNQQHWGQLGYDKPIWQTNVEQTTFQKFNLMRSLPIFTNQDFYKISNTTMNDFQRLCWKSSWLRSNLNPYIRRIQQNLKKMKESQQVFEANSTFHLFLSSFFGFKKSDLALYHPENMSFKSNPKMVDSSLDWYFNYNASFEPKPSLPSFSMFQNQENIDNYNSILMKRISTIIKNVKMNLNTNGQPQAHSFIQGHRKLEKRTQTSQLYEFLYNITSTSFPVQAITIPFSPLNYMVDDLFISSSPISRLRILWALNRTHGLTFKENTNIQKIWQSGKVREQNKSNKTKKFIQKSIHQLFPKNMKKLSFQKLKTVDQKLSWHRTNDYLPKRIFDPQKTKLPFKTFRDLKCHLKKDSIPTFSNSHLAETPHLNLSTLPRFQIEKPQKNALHFWWSMKTPFESFFPMSVRGIDMVADKNDVFINSHNSTSWSMFLLVNSMWLCGVFFHLAILFALFRIGEIRSVFKFYFLIVSKMSHGYLILLKMTWDLLETYFERAYGIFTNIKKQAFKVHSTPFKIPQNSKKPIWLMSSNLDLNVANFQVIELDQNSLVEHVWTRLPLVSLNFVQLPISKSGFDQEKTQLQSHLLTASINASLTASAIPMGSKPGTLSKKPFVFDELASLIQFPLLLTAKSVFVCMNFSLTLFYQVLYKIIDFFESCVMVIYHFLEKPAELMIEWIAQVFFIEWTSDMLSFFPDLFESQLWNAFSKFSRGSRMIPMVGFLLQRRLFSVAETVLETLSKPDIDLLERQKKGILFWDIWGEILIQAAENYQMNLVSFMTLKDEQDLFMEKLLEDSKWEWSHQSMIKMSPLFHFIGISEQGSERTQFRQLPAHFLTNRATSERPSISTNFAFSNPFCSIPQENAFGQFRDPFDRQSIFSGATKDEPLNFSKDHWRRWSVNQSFTYQGRDTDLFVDLHPPKSFHHLSFLKSTPIAQQTLGPLVCQIYSGLFTNEIAKNILLVGSPGIAKTLFIQGLAGETELKLMTDHAQRYAGVQQGIAVGMKFLKDVFDAIALYSPCIFLLEDIHLIGEKRSMLISDQENNVNNEEIFGVHQEEVHEKNQLFYHWTRHHLAHYQRPYKSDFSVGIPTNQFCFDLFFGIQPPKARPFTPKTPLPISNIEMQIRNQNGNPFEQSIESVDKLFQSQQKMNRVSSLQIPSEKTLSPPATSPFFIFALKEKQNLKPRKRVKQIPWGGFSSDQMNLLPKMAYSIRIKVALLADLAIRNLSVKLDMITDLLVILDNVRSNRGFVVFATTHMPSLLDPALRRPGRFDETISLPVYPNLFTRWEILKTNLSGFSSTCDFLDYAMVTSHFNETTLLQLISETKLSLFNLSDPFKSSSNLFPISSLNQAFQAIIEKPILLPKSKPSFVSTSINRPNWKMHSHLTLHPTVFISLTYFQIGTFFIRQNLLKMQNSYHYATWTQLHQLEKPEEFLFKQFYSPSYELKNQVTQFFSGKIAQSLVLHSSIPTNSLPTKDFQKDWILGSKNQKFSAVGGFELFWTSATAFVSALIHKRFLYQTNIVTSNLLDFDSFSLLLKPLSPPASTISMPAKKYENFQRIHRDFHQKMNLSIQNKLEMHEKQRLMKNLYQKTVKTVFRSESLADRSSPFTNSFQELGYLDSMMLKPSSVNAYYQSRMLTRHKFSFIHQWWNGQLAEHNMESTFLSDVDWRSMFVKSIGDLVIDFPDAEQYYNPRQRRWFFNSSSWDYWLHFNQTLSHEISYHFMLHCYQNASKHLQQHRESLDYYAHTLIQQSVLKEMDFITVSSRFHIDES